MAFELPDHLPRGGIPRDKATQILNKVGQTSFQEFNANLVASWVDELDDAIKETKSSVANTIQENLLEFERLFKSSADMQTRLRKLAGAVDDLEKSLESPTTGVIPKLIQTLTLYSSRERLALESEITYHALEQLLHLCLQLQKMELHMACGELPESAQICRDLDTSILNAPVPLQHAKVMLDIKKRYSTLRNRVQEQLGDAYDRCVLFPGKMELEIHQLTTVPPTLTQLPLPAILSSLSPDALTSKLASFSRDTLSKLVDSILLPQHTISVLESDSSAIFSVIFSSETHTPVQSFRSLTHFLRSHFFLHLPKGQSDFAESLYTSIGTSLLSKFLQPSIPSSLSAVPAYINILSDAVDFENHDLRIHGPGPRYQEGHIQKWCNEIAVHYEKKRREVFLEKTRAVIASPNDGGTFRVEMIVQRTVSPPPLTASTTSQSVPTATSHAHSSSNGGDEADMEQDPGGWGFDEVDTNGNDGDEGTGSKASSLTSPINVENSKAEETTEDFEIEGNWGWNDDEVTEDSETDTKDDEELVVDNAKTLQEPPANPDIKGSESAKEEEEIDPWDDDPWAAPEDEPPEVVVENNPKPLVPPPITIPPPAKTATRLEKFTAKAKGQVRSGANTPALSPAVPDIPQKPTSVAEKGNTMSHSQPLAKKELPIKESYLVTVRARRILEIAGEVLREGKELMQSNVFPNRQSQTDKLGQLLLSTAPSIIDLYRALYPILQATPLSRDSNQFMQWSNDCLFLSKELLNFKFPDDSYRNEKWVEAQDRTQTLGECCFEEAISKTQSMVHALLTEANGFANVSEQYEECKDIILKIVDEIKDTAQRWKKILSKSQYHVATGRIVEDALSRLMDEVISLQDIPQKDSEYLSEFCEMMEMLESLFIYTPGEQSTIGVYVPIWFKFSYFSWLIKGSMADISYMFEQGHLVDYEIDELVRLLRALFAETPLRESTIQRILQGNPNTQMQI